MSVRYEVFFSDRDAILRVLQQGIASAREELFIFHGFIDTRALDSEIHDALARGVRCRVLSNEYSRNTMGRFADMGVDVRVYRPANLKSIIHHKVIIIDRETVLIGSANLHDRSLFCDQENVFKIRSQAVATTFLNQSFDLWNSERVATLFDAPLGRDRRKKVIVALALASFLLAAIDIVLVAIRFI